MAAPAAGPAQWSPRCELLDSAKVKHGAEERELPLFQSWKLGEAGMDVVAYVGGPVWTMAWRPPRVNQPGLLAVNARPKTNVNQNIYQNTCGPGCVQLWQVHIEEGEREWNKEQRDEAQPSQKEDSEKKATSAPRSNKDNKKQKPQTRPFSEEDNARADIPAAQPSTAHPKESAPDERSTLHNGKAQPSHTLHNKADPWRNDQRAPGVNLALIGAILHEGKITWDLAWHPHPHALGIHKDAEGALAMALGDGTVEVHEIPPAGWMAEQGSPGVRRIVARTEALKSDRPCSVSWNPAFPEQLLVGCWNGHVSLLVLVTDCEEEANDADQEAAPLPLLQDADAEVSVQVAKKRRLTRASAMQVERSSPQGKCVSVGKQPKPTGEAGGLWAEKKWSGPKRAFQLTLRIQADDCPLRKVCWAPFEFSEEHMLFATVGHSSMLKFWDLRDPFAPQVEMRVSREWVLDMEWSPTRPRNIVMCVEDGSIRVVNLLHVFPMSAKERAVRTDKQPGRRTLWSASVSPLHGLLAFGGEDGEIVVGHIPMNEDKRKNLPLYKCAQHSFCPSSQTFKVLEGMRQEPLPKQSQRVAVRNAKDGDQDPYDFLPHPSNWITRVVWNPSLEEYPSQYLAYGTSGGFLRVLQVEGIFDSGGP